MTAERENSIGVAMTVKSTAIVDVVPALIFTLEFSPTSYEMFRDQLMDLRVALVNAEIKYQERKRNGS